MALDPPLTASELARMREYRERNTCQECKRTKRRHWPYCSQAPRDMQRRYSETKQRLEYRRVTREQFGCTCPESLAAHTHREDCPYYLELREELDKRHDADAGRPWI